MPTRFTFRQNWLLCLIVAAFLIQFWVTSLYPFHPDASPDFGALLHAPSNRVAYVKPGSLADQAGVRTGDQVIAVTGHPVHSDYEFITQMQLAPRRQPSDLEVLRNGQELKLGFSLNGHFTDGFSDSEHVAFWIWVLLAFTELAMGIFILYMRPADPLALFAALFLGVLSIQIPGSHALPYTSQTGVEALYAGLPFFVRMIRVLLEVLMLLSVFVIAAFMALFPRPIFVDRWKWIVSGLPPLAIFVFLVAVNVPLAAIKISDERILGALASAFHAAQLPMLVCLILYGLGGIASMAVNYQRCDAVQRRRMRLVFFGAIVGFGSMIPVLAISTFWPESSLAGLFRTGSAEIGFALLRILFLFCFTYAVIRYRVLEIPVLIRRSARYLFVQRGFLMLLIILGFSITLLLAHGLTHQFPARANFAVPAGAMFGVGLVWCGTVVHRRVSERIDRAFFRTVYDAEQIMQELAEKARTATSRAELTKLLREQIREALHPDGIMVYVESDADSLSIQTGRVPDDLRTLATKIPILQELAQRGRALEVLAQMVEGEPMDGIERLKPEVLVPLLGRQQPLRGLMVLGPKLSEEPYSNEDMRLLNSVASQAGIALESIGLAEEMTRRMQTEQLAAHELEIARQVQTKLLPQSLPQLQTLDYIGRCEQARAVGGDYYDLLQLRDGQVAFVMADISGKGISAALLMANLQASLRSQVRLSRDNLAEVLATVNTQFIRSVESGIFATLFIGLYDDRSGSLFYANCGHNAPFVLRSDGNAERLDANGPLLGVFEDWTCEPGETRIGAADVLVIFTDGISEALNASTEQFGETRLIESVQQKRHLAPAALVEELLREIRAFGGDEPQDDMTIILARAKSASASASTASTSS